MEVVISLLMFLGDPPILKEHLLMKNVQKCLEKKRIATRHSNNAEYRYAYYLTVFHYGFDFHTSIFCIV